MTRVIAIENGQKYLCGLYISIIDTERKKKQTNERGNNKCFCFIFIDQTWKLAISVIFEKKNGFKIITFCEAI